MRKIYYMFDKISGDVMNCFIATNEKEALRSLKSYVSNLVKSDDTGSINLMKDCVVIEIPNLDTSKSMCEMRTLLELELNSKKK